MKNNELKILEDKYGNINDWSIETLDVAIKANTGVNPMDILEEVISSNTPISKMALSVKIVIDVFDASNDMEAVIDEINMKDVVLKNDVDEFVDAIINALKDESVFKRLGIYRYVIGIVESDKLDNYIKENLMKDIDESFGIVEQISTENGLEVFKEYINLLSSIETAYFNAFHEVIDVQDRLEVLSIPLYEKATAIIMKAQQEEEDVQDTDMPVEEAIDVDNSDLLKMFCNVYNEDEGNE